MFQGNCKKENISSKTILGVAVLCFSHQGFVGVKGHQDSEVAFGGLAQSQGPFNQPGAFVHNFNFGNAWQTSNIATLETTYKTSLFQWVNNGKGF